MECLGGRVEAVNSKRDLEKKSVRNSALKGRKKIVLKGNEAKNAG